MLVNLYSWRNILLFVVVRTKPVNLLRIGMCRLNAQLRPILDLLREVENINLSPEILEPELHSIQQVLQLYKTY